MTNKAFWLDPYLTYLETKVKDVNGSKITLDETIFYAFSGGQESDSGTIGGYQVIEANKIGKEIFYTLEENHQLQKRDRVEIEIDWDRRYRLMRLHFAAELVLELICRRFPQIVRVGAHISEDKSRIDFAWDQSIASFLPEIGEEAQKIVDADQTVISAFSDEAHERRYWKINEFSQVPCGGTHIKRTREIGDIRLKRVNPGKGKERVEIYVSDKI